MRIKLERQWYIPKGAQEIRAEDSSAVAYLEPYTYRNNGAPCFHAVAFRGKQAKPVWNHTFKTEEQARKYIAKHFESVKASEAFRAKIKAERYDVRAADHFKIGDLLYTSWGYDQTNVEFFKIVRILDKSVEIVAIGGKTIKGSEGFMSCQVTPDPDRILQPETNVRGEMVTPFAMQYNGIKRVQRCGDSVYVRIHDHRSGYPIKEGGGVYESWYA